MTAPDAEFSIRIDKWLWHARFFKTRSLASRVVSGGHVRVNGTPVAKASALVRPDDVLTFPQANAVRVVRVLAPGTRRGPASEAQSLYRDEVPPEPARPRVGPRPTKKDRRTQDETRRRLLE